MRFHLDRRTGGLSRSIERGTKGIEFLLTFMLFNVLPTLLEIVMVCGILWVLYDFWFALITFVTIAGYIAFTMIVTEWRLKYRRAMNRTDNEANAKAIDSLLNYETVKYFGNEEYEARRYDDSLRRYESASVRSKTSLSLLNIGQAAIVGVGLTIIMIRAGTGVAAGRMTIGEFVLVNTYMIQLYLPLNCLGFVYREIKQSLIDMEAMFHLLDINAEIADPPGAPALRITSGELSFDHVSFAYDARRPILFDISFTVPAGRTVAIVGPSGSGKTSIVRLALRFHDPARGRVCLGGVDLRELDFDTLRKHVAVVNQDTYLFHGSAEDNIRHGRPDASMDEVVAAAKVANAHDFILRLPQGYRSVIGERGVRLSGGQRQRIAIARALLADAPILVLDEALSAVDAESEAIIQQALDRLMRGRTTLVLAHRLSSVIDADRILVLDGGRIVESGDHAALMAGRGVYHGLMAEQAREPHAVRRADLARAAAEPPLEDRQLAARGPPDDEIIAARGGLGWWRASRALLGLMAPFRGRVSLAFGLRVARVVALIGVGAVSALCRMLNIFY